MNVKGFWVLLETSEKAEYFYMAEFYILKEYSRPSLSILAVHNLLHHNSMHI